MTLNHSRKYLVVIGFALALAGGTGCGTTPQIIQNPPAASASTQAPDSGSNFARGSGGTPAGSYGGTGILASPQAGGVTSLSFNCANGTIPLDLKTVQNGAPFEADGTWVSRSGPISPAGHPTFPAHYVGTLNGTHLRLTISMAAGTGDTSEQTYDAYSGEPAVYEQACPL